MIRTTPVEEGNPYYIWNTSTVYQCTWFVYGRCAEESYSPPVWWDRATQTGSYPNANLWLENYRDPWEVKGPDYTPVPGDVIVYDGEYGHVQFCETESMYSEYRSGDPNSFSNGKIGSYKGVLLGYLHYPYEGVKPVARDKNTTQIECTDTSVRIREKPSLNANVVGHVQLGYYNVLNEKDADGYHWYKIYKDRWCADIGINYLPAEKDMIGEIERYFNSLKAEIDTLTEERNKYKRIVENIRKEIL